MEDVFGLVGHQIDNRYAIERVVAAGGFGVVYRGVHVVLGNPVALKVLKIPEALPERMHAGFIQQFVDEARILSQVQHPAIVRVTDFGVVSFLDGSRAPWMVLEWVDGGTLAADLDARRGRGGRSPRECLELLGPVIEALAVAHARGIVHRDIKPGNLMMPAADAAFTSAAGGRHTAASRLRVLDFGIAKVMDEGDTAGSGQTHTASAMPAYSPRYASPEQLGQTRTGPWTDVHALGLILTEMLVDKAPYQAADKMELQIRVMSEQRPTPARFGVDVGPWEAVLAKALALRPGDRFANAGEFLRALEAKVPETSVVVQGSGAKALTDSTKDGAQPESAQSTLRPSSVVVRATPSRSRRAALVAVVAAVVAIALIAGIAARGRTQATAATGSPVASATTGSSTRPPEPAAPTTTVAPALTPAPTLPSPPAVAAASAVVTEPATQQAPEVPPRVVQTAGAVAAPTHVHRGHGERASDARAAAPTAAPAPTPSTTTARGADPNRRVIPD